MLQVRTAPLDTPSRWMSGRFEPMGTEGPASGWNIVSDRRGPTAEDRLRGVRRLSPVLVTVQLSVLVAAALMLGVGPRRWAVAAGFLALLAVLHTVRFRRVRGDGVVFIHHLGDGLVALAVVVGADPFLAAVGVGVASQLVDLLGNGERLRTTRTDWQRRAKMNVTATVNAASACATWATTAIVSQSLPAGHPATPLVIGAVAGLTYGLVSGLLLIPVVSWVGRGSLRTPIGDVRYVTGPTFIQSAGGTLAGVLISEVHVGAIVLAVVALWPLPRLLRRRDELEQEHQQVLRLVALAADADTLTESEVADTVADAVAALLHYRQAQVRAAPPAIPHEIGTRLSDGSWLVLSDAVNLDLPDPEDQPRLDGLGALAGALIESARRRVLRNLEVRTDALTGLANRTGLGAAVAELGRDEPIAAVFLDLNGFKPLNDTYGHDAGDLVLAEVGRRLLAELRDVDVAARVGGDEFVLALPAIAEPHLAQEIASRLAGAIAEPIVLGGGVEVTVTAAVGIAVGTVGSFDHLVGVADQAMYVDKRRQVTRR